MEYRPLDITVISASELKNVNVFMRMDVYVVVSISGESSTKRKTYTDRSGGANPEWNYRIKFSVEESSIFKDFIRFQLKAERSLGDKPIGEVMIPLGDLHDDANENDSNEREVEYQVRTASGKARGSFRFSYRFGEKFTQQVQAIVPVADHTTTTQSIVEVYPPKPKPDPVSTEIDHPYADEIYPPHGVEIYPPQGVEMYPPQAVGYTMPPVMVASQYPVPPGYTYQGYGGYAPAYGYAGGYPPPPGYAYPAQPVAYAYMPMQQFRQSEPKCTEKKKKKPGFGSKLGLGLGGGMLGGLMMSEVGEMLSATADGDTTPNARGKDVGDSESDSD